MLLGRGSRPSRQGLGQEEEVPAGSTKLRYWLLHRPGRAGEEDGGRKGAQPWLWIHETVTNFFSLVPCRATRETRGAGVECFESDRQTQGSTDPHLVIIKPPVLCHGFGGRFSSEVSLEDTGGERSELGTAHGAAR